MSYLQCPECRLTVPAFAYYLRGDECPRCMTTMIVSERLTPSPRRPATEPAEPDTASA